MSDDRAQSTPTKAANDHDEIAEPKGEIAGLEFENNELREELEEARLLSSDDTPRKVFDKLRPELAAWPLSSWKTFANLINDHIEELEP